MVKCGDGLVEMVRFARWVRGIEGGFLVTNGEIDLGNREVVAILDLQGLMVVVSRCVMVVNCKVCLDK